MTNEEILKKHIPEHHIWGTKKRFYNAPVKTIIAALEEAREDERNQGRGEGPVWVKEDFIKKLQDEIDQLKAKNRADHENGDYDIYNWENAGRYGGFQDVIKWLQEPDNKQPIWTSLKKE